MNPEQIEQRIEAIHAHLNASTELRDIHFAHLAATACMFEGLMVGLLQNNPTAARIALEHVMAAGGHWKTRVDDSAAHHFDLALDRLVQVMQTATSP